MNSSSADPHVSYDVSPTVSDAITTRRSIRAFLPKLVREEDVMDMLQLASRAPSGTNTQPWRTYVLTGASREQLCTAVCEDFDNPAIEAQSEMDYYPRRWFDPYLARRRQVGWALYGLLDIKKGDRQRTHAQHQRNFKFFDAPVGLIFTLHREMATGSWLDYGMFLENLMLLARERGMHTCPQAAWADYHSTIRRVLPITDDELVVCGMALGFADTEAIENTLVTERVGVDENVVMLR